MLTWLIAIAALSALIIVHEFGHYALARAGGMHVDRFSVLGIGPVVLRLFEYKGTEFVISAIPFGAYVHIVGMEPEEFEDPDNPPVVPEGRKNFRDSSWIARALAIVGGPLANYLCAMLIAFTVFATVGVTKADGLAAAAFRDGSPAQAAGMQLDDRFISIDGEALVDGSADLPARLRELTGNHLGETVPMVVERDGTQIELQISLNPQPPALGVDLVATGERAPLPFGEALKRGVTGPLVLTAAQLKGLWQLITGEISQKVGGPVAIARSLKGNADRGAVDLILFCGTISTLLGLFNLLPLPALDGGRLAFLLYELVMRRPASKMLEEKVHMVGMLVLLSFIAWVTVGDVRGETKPMWQESLEQFRSELAVAEAEAKSAPPTTLPEDGGSKP